MARKRRRPQSPAIESGSETADSLDDFELDSQLNVDDLSEEAIMESDDIFSTDEDISEKHLYKQVLVNEYRKLLNQQTNIKRQINRQNEKLCKKPKDTFSCFSVTTFSKVVSAVSASKRHVIESYGFGSLLDFDKCFVPWKFAKWIAQQVDYKSGDLIFADKVISLTPESVNHVLGIPVGGRPFPVDFSAGKSVILQKFNKHNIPSVMFFADKLTKELHTLTDEDIFVCFLLVALTTFLCPNASQIPSQKHLGIFSDITTARQFDWGGYILRWLFDHIRTFNRGKSSKVKDEGTLGGCLYYLAVIYLDFVDFGPRMVSDDIPRIAVWKQSMIQSYSQLDMKSNGCYGFRPKLPFNETCYAKNLHLIDSRASLDLDDDFMDQLDTVSRCKLPDGLKSSICNIVQKHSFNSGLSVQMDLSAISRLPYNLHTTLTKLLQHASSVDSRSKKLVLEVMKEITEYPYDDIEHETGDLPTEPTSNGNPVHNSEVHDGADVSDDEQNTFHQHHSPIHSPVPMNLSSQGTESSLKAARESTEDLSPHGFLSPQNQLQSSKVNQSQLNKVLHKPSNTNESPCTPIGSSKHYMMPAHVSSKCRLEPVPIKCKPRLNSTETLTTQSNIAILRNPLSDISNLEPVLEDLSRKNATKTPSVDGRPRDFIQLDDDDCYAPDSLSPLPRPRCISNSAIKCTPDCDKENFSPQLTQKAISRVTPNIQSRERHVRFASVASTSKGKDSPEVQILVEKTLSQRVRDMTKIGDDLYNKKFCSNQSSANRTPSRTPAADIPTASHSSANTTNDSSAKQPYVSRDSSTGGKLPLHGPRRPIKTGPIFNGDYETDKQRISISSSELKNYQTICKLANSESSRDDVVVVGKVRCTFWALGESLKPEGFVNSFVVSAFCYSLFLKPAGQPEQSKSHYFFANIGAELMKDPDESNQDVLCRAFKRSHRSRPLNHCNNLYFPVLFNNHWSVFVVNIKDRNFVFLDSLHHEDHEYQEIVRECIVPSFQLHWNKYINVAMGFDQYKFLYPDVPQQEIDNSVDSGIYAMMCLQYWKSPRSVLSKCFESSDIPRIRIKIANELLLLPGNTGNKDLVLQYQL